MAPGERAEIVPRGMAAAVYRRSRTTSVASRVLDRRGTRALVASKSLRVRVLARAVASLSLGGPAPGAGQEAQLTGSSADTTSSTRIRLRPASFAW